MKIPKKHAVALATFIDCFLTEGFYPFDESEEMTISKVVAFMLYHSLISEKAFDFFIRKLSLLRPDPTARLDLIEQDVDRLLDMVNEVYRQTDLHGDEPSALVKTEKYLLEAFFDA
jgi:hypothetical protein